MNPNNNKYPEEENQKNAAPSKTTNESSKQARESSKEEAQKEVSVTPSNKMSALDRLKQV